jgi:hypothetical protein
VAQLRTNGSEDIKKHLEMCYHELNQTKKKIFLDIACFFGHQETFEGMYNLRLLKIYYPSFLENPSKEQIMNGKRVGIHLPGGLHFLSSELRFLYWYNYPLKSLPSKFFPEKPFQLEMPCSQLEQFGMKARYICFITLLFQI